jgi:hypothetical protein
MRTHIHRSPAGDRGKTTAPQAPDSGDRGERRLADVQGRRLPVQTERVGHAIIVVTCFD